MKLTSAGKRANRKNKVPPKAIVLALVERDGIGSLVPRAECQRTDACAR